MKEHKVLITGDSHARHCAANVKTDVKENFEVQGLMKPAAGTDILVNSAHKYISTRPEIWMIYTDPSQIQRDI